MSTPSAPEGRYASFEAFYPYYIHEHSNRTCRRIHVVGTGLVIAAFGVFLVTWNPWWLLAMPVLGYLVLSYNDKPVYFYGFDILPLTAKDPDFAKQIKSWHELGGTIGYWLIGLHAVAGLGHHYLIKDNTLLRMLPGRS